MTEQTKDTSLPYIVKFPDFLCDHPEHQKPGDKVPCQSQDHWFYALNEIRKTLYTNTSATISAPFYHILDYERKSKLSINEPPRYHQLADIHKMADTYSFNAKPFAADDIYSYRQQRSEHLLIRMAHCINSDEITYTFIRLSQGIFLVQKYQPSDPIEFPSRTTFDQSFQVSDNNAAPVGTFSFDGLFNDMMQQTQAATATEAQKSFVPFTYTLGIRFTNPYQDTRDIIVRGKIPLWCQTLFITECMRQLPILPNTTKKNLLPFLKDMEFRFTPILEMKDGYSDPYPDLAVIFERFAMELCDPQMIWQNIDYSGRTWEDSQKGILNKIVLCDIPDQQAAYITSVANQWAMSQGILLQ